MSLFRNVILVAAIAGLFAGLAMAAMQSYATAPLIMQAEVFENAGQADGGDRAETADRGHQAWAPEDGLERTSYTVLANIVTAIGFAIVFVALAEFAGGLTGWRQGMIWGLAVFGAVTLAPGLGLPPELPAMPVADLAARQVWWLGTVGATAVGLALIAFGSNGLAAIAGVALIVAPHLIGAPQPLSHETPIPESLHHQFVVMSTLTSLIFWLVLGGLCGLVRPRLMASGDADGASLA